jgi:hypothetical protein
MRQPDPCQTNHRKCGNPLSPPSRPESLFVFDKAECAPRAQRSRRLHALVPESRYTELPCGHDDFYNDWGNVRAFLIESGVLRAE